MSTIDELNTLTNNFFDKHWNKNSSQPFPVWSSPWKFVGSVPHNESAGCYAWIKSEKVVYVGVALNKGTERYKNHSLGSRIKNYWKMAEGQKNALDKRIYNPSDKLRLYEIDAIVTLPFEEQKYLAIALEYYLIQELSGLENKIYKRENEKPQTNN